MNLSPRKEEDGSARRPLPMVSMIDVVFLLLIFFMVTSNLAEEEERLAAALAAEGRAAADTDLQPQIVELELRGGEVSYSIGARTMTDRAELLDVLQRLPKAPGVVVRVSDEVPVWSIAAALQTASDAGFEKRSYVPRSQ